MKLEFRRKFEKDNINMKGDNNMTKLREVNWGNENPKQQEMVMFTNVTEVYRNKELVKYQTIANAQFLGSLLDREILEYQGDLQRGWKENSKGKLVAVKSEKHIKEILQSVCQNKMHGGFITLNLNPKDMEEVIYDEEEHTISLPITHKLQILDGNHRLNAFSRWVKQYKRKPESVPNPAEYYISVVIEMLDEESAKTLFSEYCLKSLKINKSRGEFLNVEDNTNKLCREIIRKSDLNNRVEVISTSIKGNSSNVISFGVLSKIVKENYSPQTKKEIEDYSEFLTLFIDCLFEVFPNFLANKNLGERNELRKTFLTMEPLAWSGYIKVSKHLQGKSREELLDILSKFNKEVEYKGWKGYFLQKDNPIFSKVMREGSKIINTSTSGTWVNKVFVEYIINGKSLEEIRSEG